MPAKPRFLCMDKGDALWQKLDDATDEWDKSIRTKEIYRAVGNLILKYKAGQAELMHSAIKGGYNVVYRLEYKDGSSVIMRIPIKGVVPFPEEKVRYEVATMRYVAANTTIPVPHVYHYGTAAENPTGLGPFIIMDYVEHCRNMSRELLDPERAPDRRPILHSDIAQEKLEYMYAQMANILLQLSTLKFPQIGSLVEDESEASLNNILPSRTYDSADEWHRALADMHMAQLAFQRNDAVEDEDDARDKPANVLIDKELRVVDVIDWEFAYAAPAEFSYDPPWWLLLEEPDYWDGGYRAWIDAYEPRLQTFLRLLEAEEQKMMIGTGNTGPLLSQRMRQSWEQRTWMVNCAARKSWAFDFIWWKFLDEGYFGENESQDYQARLDLLSEPQKEIMESFVQNKMEEARNDGNVE